MVLRLWLNQVAREVFRTPSPWPCRDGEIRGALLSGTAPSLNISINSYNIILYLHLVKWEGKSSSIHWEFTLKGTSPLLNKWSLRVSEVDLWGETTSYSIFASIISLFLRTRWTSFFFCPSHERRGHCYSFQCHPSHLELQMIALLGHASDRKSIWQQTYVILAVSYGQSFICS